MTSPLLPASERVDVWLSSWRRAGGMVLLLDFDGTLAPIVERPEEAAIEPAARAAIERLIARGAAVAIISGRGLSDARERVGIADLAYAGNHGMEIEMPGLRRIHPDAERARPALDGVVARLRIALGGVDGALVEDKRLTLSIHYRQVERTRVAEVRDAVREAVAPFAGLRVTEGKEVLEVRPDVEWDKGRAVEFLLGQLRPPPGAPLVYFGDDRTDEDAFVVLGRMDGGEGVFVGSPVPPETAASSWAETTKEVARLIDLLAGNAPA